MTKETKSYDVSYVTEAQRAWIESQYGLDWDSPQIKIVQSKDWAWFSDSEEITADTLMERIDYAMDCVPEEHKSAAVLKLTLRSHAAYIYPRYRRPETEDELNRRIDGYLHEWELARNEHLEQMAMFNQG